jgi:hypothetical protein
LLCDNGRRMRPNRDVPFLAENIMTQLETVRFAPATEKTDQLCPYSRVLRGGIDVAVNVL